MLTISTFSYLDSAKLFNRIAGEEWALYLDSGNSEGKKPRAVSEQFDVLLMRPISTLVTRNGVTELKTDNGSESLNIDPLAAVQNELEKHFSNISAETRQQALAQNDAGYLPGAFGYFSYDLARQFENLPTIALDDEQLPEMAIGIYTSVVVIDHAEQLTTLISAASAEGLHQSWSALIERELNMAETTESGVGALQAGSLSENQSRDEYRAKFAAVRDYTIEGDCYQVNLTKRFACEVTGSAWGSYQNLRRESPAPYGAYLHLPFAEVLSNSPESFIRCHDRQVITSPIKGTRPRDHKDPARDQAIAKELAESPKDRAENVMIVDLMRNDLSRCCELGSVKVPSLFSLHAFANVHHLISTVTGVLRRDLHVLDLLRSCFPGGSITGAPKIRAMEIIEELEPHRRGLYCGSIGYVGMDGSLETNIAIRTIVVKDGVARYAAGGGLVIDSESESEYQELLDKASMMNKVLSSSYSLRAR